MLVRLEFSIGNEVRYLSHLDFLRLFIRALRRAGLPVTYSQGFNPHPKLAFGPPLAVGITSACEYLDLELENAMPLAELLERLGQALPQGVTLIQAKEIKEKAPALMAVIDRACFQVKVPLRSDAMETMEWPAVISSFMERPSIVVARRTKKGPQPKEIRTGLFRMEAEPEAKTETVVFNLELQVGSQGAVRPDEVIRALIELEEAPLLEDEMQIRRTGLYTKEGERLLTPLEII